TAPTCGFDTVATVYAVGTARHAAMAMPAATVATRRGSRATTRRSAAAPTPAIATASRNGGSQSRWCDSITAARITVTTTVADIEVQVAEATWLVAGQPSEPVVAQGQFDDAVVLRAADVRTCRCRPQFDQHQIPPAGHDQCRGRGRQPPHPRPQGWMGSDQVC